MLVNLAHESDIFCLTESAEVFKVVAVVDNDIVLVYQKVLTLRSTR